MGTSFGIKNCELSLPTAAGQVRAEMIGWWEFVIQLFAFLVKLDAAVMIHIYECNCDSVKVTAAVGFIYKKQRTDFSSIIQVQVYKIRKKRVRLDWSVSIDSFSM